MLQEIHSMQLIWPQELPAFRNVLRDAGGVAALTVLKERTKCIRVAPRLQLCTVLRREMK